MHKSHKITADSPTFDFIYWIATFWILHYPKGSKIVLGELFITFVAYFSHGVFINAWLPNLCIPFILHHPITVVTSLWPQLFIIVNSWKWHPDIPCFPLSGHFFPFWDVVLPCTVASTGPPTHPLEIGAVRQLDRYCMFERKGRLGQTLSSREKLYRL